MTDRELLELAARAAGIEGEWVEDSLLDDYYKLPTTGYLTVSEGRNHVWNPLTSSGDALRLAVRLSMCVTSFTDEQLVGYVINGEGHNVHEAPGGDSYAATRRAIVRAAAEIGKGMQ